MGSSTYPGAVDQFDIPTSPATTPQNDPGDTSPARDMLELLDDLGAAVIAAQTELDATKAAAVLKALFDANTILAANTDNTPAALSIPASRVVGRKATGNIAALTPAELRTLLPMPTMLTRATATLGETYPRMGQQASNTILTSGRLHLVACVLEAGTTITNVAFVSGTTGATTPTHQIFALYDKNLVRLRVTADDTSTAWAGTAIKSLALTSTYLVPTTDLYYLGIMVAAATPPTLMSTGSAATTVVNNLPPITTGYDATNTGLTTTLPDPAAALTAHSLIPYAYVT